MTSIKNGVIIEGTSSRSGLWFTTRLFSVLSPHSALYNLCSRNRATSNMREHSPPQEKDEDTNNINKWTV